jgi:hypothetical protein
MAKKQFKSQLNNPTLFFWTSMPEWTVAARTLRDDPETTYSVILSAASIKSRPRLGSDGCEGFDLKTF